MKRSPLRHRAFLFLSLAFLPVALPPLSGGCTRGKTPSADGSAPESIEATLPAALGPALGTVSRIAHRKEVPLEGPRVDAVAGDWLLRGKDRVAVIAADGRIVDFGTPGGADGVGFIEPELLEGPTAVATRTTKLAVVAAKRGGQALYARRVSAAGDVLHLWRYFRGSILVEEAVVEAAGKTRRPLRYGARLAWGNSAARLPGLPEPPPSDEAYQVAYVARGERLAGEPAYAMTAGDGPVEVYIGRADLPGFSPVPEARAPVAREREHRVFFYASDVDAGRAALALPPIARAGTSRLRLPDAPMPPASRIELAGCAATPTAPAERAAFLFPMARSLEVPRCARMRITAPGRAPTAWHDLERLPASPAAFVPRGGRVVVDVSGEPWPGAARAPLPARLDFRGVAPTPDPDFGEACAVDAERRACGAGSSIHAERSPVEVALAPGRYRLRVDRGFAYTRHETEIEVKAEGEARLDAQLRRVVDTHGYLAADLHLHAAPSPDAPTSLEDRVRSLAAAGVEVGVATDHNRVTDYGPAIERLGLRAAVASVIGDEVTTRAPVYGHYNVFPIDAATEPFAFEAATPARIVEAARRAKPFGAATIVQLNHPRMGDLGLFTITGFQRAAPRAYVERVPGATLGFDAIEVFNGDHYDDLAKVEEVLADWIALVDAGLRITATGSSDSHKLAHHEAGVPRTYVEMPSDEPARFDAKAFVGALRAGRAIVSSGPFIQLEVDGRGPGARVAPGTSSIALRVSAPPWVDVTTVELRKRGRPWKRFDATPTRATLRLDVRLREPLAAGDWLIALARGARPMEGFRRAAVPFAFTNPIYVDGRPTAADAGAPQK